MEFESLVASGKAFRSPIMDGRNEFKKSYECACTVCMC